MNRFDFEIEQIPDTSLLGRLKSFLTGKQVMRTRLLIVNDCTPPGFILKLYTREEWKR